MKHVIIVESPAKSKTIQHYLGDDYIVTASVGHIRELAKNGPGGLGVDTENGFKATYKIDKKHIDIVKDLLKLTKNNQVYLATDPDREGEAIAWHLAQVLNLDLHEKNRITFNEVTKKAILEAIQDPRQIDMDLVKSQETRRILDRIIGFKLSPLLQKKIKSESAGRVQSVALKMIVDLEKEITAFVPKPYYTITAHFDQLDGNHIWNKSKEIDDEAKLNAILNKLKGPFTVTDINKRKRSRGANVPYITSTFQQDAVNKLGFSGAQAMRYAQKLYEGIDIKSDTVGLITYMRTDSTRLNDDFVKETFNYIRKTYGETYLGKVKNKQQVVMQDAHEAIHPTSIERTPESMRPFLDEHEYKIYDLIFKRTVQSMMSDALYEEQHVLLDCHGETFEYGGSKLLHDGFHKADKDYEEKLNTIVELTLGETLNAKSITHEALETKPKSRYSEASLIKDMEEFGIGRPSTYAETNRTLITRKYVERKQKTLYPTDQGMLTIDALDQYFSNIINTSYTKKLEMVLDNIAESEENHTDVLEGFYHKFMDLVKHADTHMEKVKPVSAEKNCPLCGAPLVIRKGKKGNFIGCSNYPKCKHTENIEKTSK